MSYELDPGADVADDLRRIAREQVSSAIQDLDDPDDGVVEAIHDCRKRCKKLRGLIRLVRPALGDHYSAANTTFRDAARHLGPLRDAQALHGTFAALCAAQREHLPDDGLASVDDELRRRSERSQAAVTTGDPRVQAAKELLGIGEAMIEEWELDRGGFGALAGGLGRTYRRGRKAFERALRAPTGEAFHDYRKRVKYTWYHVRLLEPTAPSVLAPLGNRLHDLSDALGDEHDLGVLSSLLLDEPDPFGGNDRVGSAMLVIDGQRADLRRRAVGLGARLHAERTKVFVGRASAYWDAWQSHGDEPRAGEIGKVTSRG